jgi:outer membrane protein assembly factor BamD
MFRKLFVFLLLSVAVAACGGGGREGSGHVEYSVSAKQNYDRGMKSIQDSEWVDAVKYFSFVKARFPYSKYAVLADLRMADAAFGAGEYLEAIDGFQQFIKFHPTHEMVENGYAAFRVGESYFKMLPDDWFLVPPAYEKDQSATQDALREIQNFIRKYPKSTYVERAEKMRVVVAHKLAQTEWYVANFYWNRHKPMATVLRLRTLLRKYPDVGFDEDALWLLSKAYVKVGRVDSPTHGKDDPGPANAKEALQELVDKHVNKKHFDDARRELAKYH